MILILLEFALAYMACKNYTSGANAKFSEDNFKLQQVEDMAVVQQ